MDNSLYSQDLGKAKSTYEPFVDSPIQANVLHHFNFSSYIDSKKTLVISADPTNGPYDISDFLPSVLKVVKSSEISHFGSTCISSVFTLGLVTEDAAAALVREKEIPVRNSKALILSLGVTVRIYVDWLPPELPDEKVLQHFLGFGQIMSCDVLRYDQPGLEHVLSSRRLIRIALKPGTKLSDIPSTITVDDVVGSVVILGKQLMCYEFQKNDHVLYSCHLDYDSSQSGDGTTVSKLKNNSSIETIHAGKENGENVESKEMDYISHNPIDSEMEIRLEQFCESLGQNAGGPNQSFDALCSNPNETYELTSHTNFDRDEAQPIIVPCAERIEEPEENEWLDQLLARENFNLEKEIDLKSERKGSPNITHRPEIRTCRENVNSLLHDLLGVLKTATRQLMSQFTEDERPRERSNSMEY